MALGERARRFKRPFDEIRMQRRRVPDDPIRSQADPPWPSGTDDASLIGDHRLGGAVPMSELTAQVRYSPALRILLRVNHWLLL